MAKVVLLLVLLVSNLVVMLALVVPGLLQRQNFLYKRDGDINIGYLVSIHEMSNEASVGKCDVLRKTEIIIAEAFFFAIDHINSRSDILPNISLGFVALDNCLSETKALEAAIYMTTPMTSPGDVASNRSRGECASDATASDDPVVGVIGLSNSRMAVALAPYFGAFQIPTLSLSATSDELSDKSHYEYFSRLIPSDNFQEQTLLQIAGKMGWTFLSLVYSGGAYGENAALQINRLLRTTFRNICLAASVRIPSDAETEEFENAARYTVSGVIAAKVVLVFIQENHLKGFFDAARRFMRPGEKVLFLGGDGISELQAEPFADVLEGAIYTDSDYVIVPGIKQYVSGLSPWVEPRDVWFSILWQDLFGCRLDNPPASPTPTKSCNPNQTFSEVSDAIEWSVPNAARSYDAAYVFAYALNNLIRHSCPEAFRDKSKLRNCISGQSLLQHIRNTSFQGTTDWITFDVDGDLIGGLAIRQYQRQEDAKRFPIPVRIGIRNSSAAEVTLNLDEMDWKRFSNNTTSAVVESVCSKPCGANEFPIVQDKTCCWVCVKCRSNEIISKNRTSCQPCPKFSWPDEDEPMSCTPINPISLQMSHSLSLSLLCLASIGCSVSLIVSVVYCMKRNHRRIKATSIELSLVILTGTVLANVTVILFLMEPRQELCVVRSIGFHVAINLLYGPLLVKNVRTYRIFRAGETTVRMPRFVGRWTQFAFAAILAAVQVGLYNIRVRFALETVSCGAGKSVTFPWH